MNEDNEIKKAISDIVKVSKRLSRVSKPNQNVKNSWLNEIASKIWSSKYENLIRNHAEKGRSFLGSIKRYNQNPENYLKYILPHANAIEDYIKENPQFSKKYGWNTPLIATRYRMPGSERFIGIDDVIRKNEESNTDVQSGSAPPIKPPPRPPTSNPPPSPDDDDDGKNKAPKKWGVYKHNFTDILKGVDKSDIYKNKKQDSKTLSAEKENTKGVNENTKALYGLRAFLGPYAKAFMPYYAANMLINGARSDTAASVARVSRRTFGGLYGASRDIAGYIKMFRLMSARGANESDVMKEYAGQKKWASTLMFGMGLDKIEALAMVLGKAPGPAEMRDPELMQRWLRENMRGITDMQAMQLSAMGVASDEFIEGARRGEATDADSRANILKRTYDSLYEQTGLLDNPFRKAQYLIGSTAASDISSRTPVGVAANLAMSGLGMFGKMYEHGDIGFASMIPGMSTLSNLWKIASGLFGGISNDNVGDFRTIPRQTSVTVNINGNIDSEERAHSFAEQIGTEVSNAEK